MKNKPIEGNTIYLGGRIHAKIDRFNRLKITEHNGRAVIQTIIIPKSGLKTFIQYLEDNLTNL